MGKPKLSVEERRSDGRWFESHRIVLPPPEYFAEIGYQFGRGFTQALIEQWARQAVECNGRPANDQFEAESYQLQRAE